MASIVIKDLPVNIELDRQAMRAISGGKAALRPGSSGYRSSFFQNPLTFDAPKLLGPIFGTGTDWGP